MAKNQSDPFLVLKIAQHGCTYEEAEELVWITNILGIYLQSWQEAALLEIRRAHKEGRTPFAYPHTRKDPRADFYAVRHADLLRAFRDRFRQEKGAVEQKKAVQGE